MTQCMECEIEMLVFINHSRCPCCDNVVNIGTPFVLPDVSVLSLDELRDLNWGTTEDLKELESYCSTAYYTSTEISELISNTETVLNLIKNELQLRG